MELIHVKQLIFGEHLDEKVIDDSDDLQWHSKVWILHISA